MKHQSPTLTKLGRVETLTFGKIFGLVADVTPDSWRFRPLPP